MTRFVEIFQIKGVVPNLINRCAIKLRLTDFEFYHKHHGTDEDYRIHTTPHARNLELQVERPR